MRVFISFDRIKWRFTGLTHINECGIKEWYLDNFINCNLEAKHILKTRMHSSRVYTIYCSSHFSCHAYPPPQHACPRYHELNSPYHTHPLPHTPTTHAPCHVHPLPYMPPLPHMPPCHACRQLHMPPPPCHACPPLPHMPRKTDVCENITFPQLLLRTVTT